MNIDELIEKFYSETGSLITKKQVLHMLEIKPFIAYTPHDIQRKFHQSDKKIRWFLGGNRSGKTRAGGQEAIWWATGTHPFKEIKTPVDVWIVSLDYPTSRDTVQPLIRQLIGSRYLKRWYESDRIVELTNGSTIGFKSVDSGWEKFQGTAKNLIWFDEEPKYDVYQECLMRLIDRRGVIIGTMTPLHGMSWVYDEIYEPWELATRDDIECFVVSSYDNPYISSDELDIIKKNNFGEILEARLYGKFIEFAGLIYKEFDRNVHLIKRFPIPKHWTKLRGLDPGVNNPTACTWWAVSPDNDHYVYDEYYETDKTAEENSINIKAKTGLDEISATYVDPSACNRNPAHPELKSLRDEYSRFGLYTVPANNDVLFGINKVRSFLDHTTKSPKLHIFNDCMHTIREMVRYRWASHRFHKDEKNAPDKPQKVSDHLMDAMRYVAASDPIYFGDYAEVDIIEGISDKSSRKFTKYG